jgi:protein tyrosine/serine phosphatase
MIVAMAILGVLMTVASTLGAVVLPEGTSPSLSGPVKGASVKQYGIVDPGILSRSGRPTPAGYAWLRQQGVNSIVNFTDKDTGAAVMQELGFAHYLWLPLHGPPTEAVQAERFLSFVRDAQHWPVHMHCHAGQDRTGVMGALVRYAIDGWPLEAALAEARRYKGHALAPKYLTWLNEWVASHPPGSHRLMEEGRPPQAP